MYYIKDICTPSLRKAGKRAEMFFKNCFRIRNLKKIDLLRTKFWISSNWKCDGSERYGITLIQNFEIKKNWEKFFWAQLENAEIRKPKNKKNTSL